MFGAVLFAIYINTIKNRNSNNLSYDLQILSGCVNMFLSL